MPIQFLLIFLCLHGTRILVEGLCKLRRYVLTPRASLHTLEVFIAVVVAINMPRVANVSFYHQYLSLSGRFYDKIRHGEFSELPAVCDTLRHQRIPDKVIAAPDDKISIFHFLSGRRVVGLPSTDSESKRTGADAEAIVSFIQAHPDIDLVVFDWSQGPEEFRRCLRALAETDARLMPIQKLKRFHIYRRTQPPSTSSSAL